MTLKPKNATIKLSKTVNEVTTTYYLNVSQILAEETNGNITLYVYDESGAPIGMQYHGANYADGVWDVYWYEKNIFGDVITVYDEYGTKLMSYVYEAYGEYGTQYFNSGSTTTAINNPFRYRGYYYDKDLSLYYLNTRYYDSSTGRFTSPDSYVSTGQGILGNNMYAYCGGNPVMRVDPTGEWWNVLIGAAIGGTVSLITSTIEHFADDKKLEAKEFGQIAISNVIGSAEGALVALFPGASPVICAGAAMLDTAINGLIDKEDPDKIIDDTIISGLIGAACGMGGSAFAKGGKIVSATVGKLAVKEGLESLFNSNFLKWAADTIGEILKGA